ncbi:4-alpha-glucanotransferase [Bifidobacterium callimiconis]|uniref:4-alpha-glucanotransferase n=1 Tax=Bifidobacterium callimiconis TaxID=2306973 RepID=A0A430FCH2_9BIFI|nr:4-alpha-glucanotransferase [Bifidobacterium callimiconis]MBT1177439.1 4-alpha-glucanotransferase [Bifidobacterium callimiconis]RSX50492.1 4-alpha-glucanotransferase [Bifidobacterium callimiconis]
MEQREETKERLSRPLIQLAKMKGVATFYVGQQGEYVEIDDDVLVDVLRSLGVDASSKEAILDSLRKGDAERYSRLVPATLLHIAGQESKVKVNNEVFDVPSAKLVLEDGTEYSEPIKCVAGDGAMAKAIGDKFIVNSALVIPAGVPLGYHTLIVTVGNRTEKATLISAPAKIDLLDPMKNGHLWGWMAQFYSVRSQDSWGVGDFADLKTMLRDAKEKTGADFMLINPVHAGEPCTPLTPSPYLPISRRFVNFTYINPQSVPEYSELSDEAKAEIDRLHETVGALNDDAEKIDRDAMWNAKMPALWTIFKAGRTPERQREFDAFKAKAGEDLEGYATWCLAYDKWGAPTGEPGSWVKTFNRDSPEVAQLRSQYPDTLDFYRWLEWIADEQLADAQQTAQDANMTIGLMSDMAVGVHPYGSDVWWNPERFAYGATVGAPPDFYNQQGQNWSQPPLNPNYLAATGYKAYRDIVAGMFAHAGAVRIDHAIGLFRLWWIPEGRSAKKGAYVYYDSAVMLGILALEATRAHGVVVGEDLGVVPEYMAHSLAEHGLLGCAIEWFEQRDGKFRRPQDWRPLTLASVTTHDIPPTAGYLTYEHVKLRSQLHLLTGSEEEFMADAKREHDALLSMLADGGFIKRGWLNNEAEHEQDLIEGMHRALCASPSKLLCATITDGVGEKRTQNQPGTNNEYPNWRIPLADGNGRVVSVENLFSNERVQSLAAVMRGEK